MKLSIVIPAYNEEKRVVKTLKDISGYLEKQDYEAEVIVVNDGSSDSTVKVVTEMKKELPGLRLIDNKKNKGKGGVVKQGVLEAQGDFILFTDADNSTGIQHLEKMWPEFEKKAELVIGTRDSRDKKGAKQAVPQPVWKRLFGDIGNLVIQFLLLPGIWDTQCGFKAFTKQAGQKLFKKSKGFRWAFDIEILKLARKMGYKIALVPVYWVNDSESSFKLKGYVRFFKEFFKIKWNFLTGKYEL